MTTLYHGTRHDAQQGIQQDTQKDTQQDTNRISTLLLAAGLGIALATAAPAQADWTGDASLTLGSKRFQDTDWVPGDSHKDIGLLIDAGKETWPVRIAIDLFGTGRESTRAGAQYDTFTGEADIGLRKVFELPIPDCRLRPYIGAGLALVYAEQEVAEGTTVRRADDTATGFWVGAGTRVEVTPSFTLGIDLRYSDATATLPVSGSDTDIELGAITGGLTAGFHW